MEARIADIVAPSLDSLGYELVRVAIMGRDRPTVQLMIDRADGEPIGIEDCETVSHHIGAVIDVADPMTAAWTLEISSPGIDRPLTRRKDWNRYSGHQARVELEMPDQGRKRLTGVVLGADDTTARLRLDDGSEMGVRLDNVRRAKLLLTEALIAATRSEARLH
jgi:ribosome maturation factor RimP